MQDHADGFRHYVPMAEGYVPPGNRIFAAFGAGALVAGVMAVLAFGLVARGVVPPQRALQLLDFAVPPPPPPEPEVKPKPRAAPRQQGKAAPPNRVSRATEVVAPKPVVPLPVPTPVIAAPIPAQGNDAASGSAPLAGPGTGAGGQGNGFGSGGAGNGSGGGGGTVLRHIRGDITDDDYPEAAARIGAQGTVTMRFTVGVDGRVTDCVVTRSSGNRDLDETTCRLIRKRFRYTPSRDASGKPYADVVTGEQTWELYDRPRP
jgi:periplasmic protein TonB